MFIFTELIHVWFFLLVSSSFPHSLHVRIVELVQDVVSVLLLPLYFAVSGLKTDLTLLDNATSWGICVLTILAACLGTFLCFMHLSSYLFVFHAFV